MEVHYRVDAGTEEAFQRPVNCKTMPFACEEPFNCHRKHREHKTTIATKDGFPDYSEWCGAKKELLSAISNCVNGHLKTYAVTLHKAQDAHSEYADAHYCFAWGHCDNTDVQTNTSIYDAPDICDKHLGHDTWALYDRREPNFFDSVFAKQGFFTEVGLLHIAKKACAMGTYHCDVVYCQMEYCHNPWWRDLFNDVRPADLRAKHGDNYPIHNYGGSPRSYEKPWALLSKQEKEAR